MKNPLKICWIDFDELFPIRVMWEIFALGLVLFGLGWLWSKMWLIYTWLWLIALSIMIFILANISQAIKLFIEWKIIKASIRLALTFWLTLLAAYMWYNLYLSLRF